MEHQPEKLGEFGSTVVRIILRGFGEKKLMRKPQLTLGKYLGAYTTAASQGVLLGLRFRQTPVPILKLVCEVGEESNLAGYLRLQASSLASEFSYRDVNFLDISMEREQARPLSDPQKQELLENPFALARFMNKTAVDLKQAYDNLVACFALFLGLGLFQSDWMEQTYMRFIPGKD